VVNPLRTLCRRRPFHFGLVGAAAAGVQLAILHGLLAIQMPVLVASCGALSTAANLNFTLSALLTRSDRTTDALGKRWSGFYVAISVTPLLNKAVYAVTRPLIGQLQPAGLGFGDRRVANYVMWPHGTRIAVEANQR